MNALLIAFEFYYAPILPVLLFVMLLAFFALDKLVLFIVFLTPLSVNLTEIGLGVGLTLPTDPLLFGVLLIFILKLFAERRFDKRIANHPVTLAIIINLVWIGVTTVTLVCHSLFLCNDTIVSRFQEHQAVLSYVLNGIRWYHFLHHNSPWFVWIYGASGSLGYVSVF